jgi:two-component system sensor histidine kinase RegB
MGRAGKDDLHLRITPWSALIREAAEPHLDRGKNVKFVFDRNLEFDLDQPTTFRKPEVIHGLRNLIQNAVDFAQSEVKIDVGWSEAELFVTISDDGRGFAPQVINRIGDPFMRRRKRDAQNSARPGYDGMGLGLFIAKTLLERSGAKLEFRNASGDNSLPGAVVHGVWPRRKLEAAELPIGQNRPIEVG